MSTQNERNAALIADSRRVMVLAWQGSGEDIARLTGLRTSPGVAQLLAGEASLEEAIQMLPDGGANIITAGSGDAGATDGDSAAMVLDALDDMYDFVVVYGSFGVAKELFATLQGRFDAGVVVADVAPEGALVSFLGFNVPDFLVALVRHGSAENARPASPRAAPAQRRRTLTAGARI